MAMGSGVAKLLQNNTDLTDLNPVLHVCGFNSWMRNRLQRFDFCLKSGGSLRVLPTSSRTLGRVADLNDTLERPQLLGLTKKTKGGSPVIQKLSTWPKPGTSNKSFRRPSG